MNTKTSLDIWSEICGKFTRSNDAVHPVHACVIDGERHYVHSPQLEQDDPEYFGRLRDFAQCRGIKLKADRRRAESKRGRGRRKKLLPIIFLALGTQSTFSIADSKTSLNLFHQTSKNVKHVSESGGPGPASDDLDYDEAAGREILAILQQHLVLGEDDPPHFQEEIQQIAHYYAKYPEVVSLIRSISARRWTLRYAPHTFQTDVAGTRLSVNEVTVYFDPRSGAKLKFYDKCAVKKPFCIATPADALLHELLHVQTIVNDTKAFIAQGGLGQHIYPMEHERLTILKENKLYKAMSQRDRRHRPIRNEHSGRHVLVSCVTCVD